MHEQMKKYCNKPARNRLSHAIASLMKGKKMVYGNITRGCNGKSSGLFSQPSVWSVFQDHQPSVLDSLQFWTVLGPHVDYQPP